MAVDPTQSAKSNATMARRWVLVAFVVLLLTILAGVYNTELVQPKTYRATTLLSVLPAQPTPSTTSNPTTAPIDSVGSFQFQTEHERILSQAVLEPVIDGLGLDKIWTTRIYKSQFETLPMDDALIYLRSVLSVKLRRGTNVIVIAAVSEIPQEAADIANGVAARYKVLLDDGEFANSSGLSKSSVKIIKTADVPTLPYGPNRILNFALSVAKGGFIGGVVATVLEIYVWLASRPARGPERPKVVY